MVVVDGKNKSSPTDASLTSQSVKFESECLEVEVVFKRIKQNESGISII